MLPDISGEGIIGKIRETSNVHIIMLTAKIDDDERIEGFNLGCDDYVCKLFNVKELVFRIKAVFRKLEGEDREVLYFGEDLKIDTVSHEVEVRGTY